MNDSSPEHDTTTDTEHLADEHAVLGGRSFLAHAAIYGLGTLALQGAGIILVPLYTRYLVPAEFGILEILDRIGDVFLICLMANGIRMAALTFYKQAVSDEERGSTAATLSLFLATVLGGAFLLTIGFAQSISGLVGIENPALLVLGIASILLQATSSIPMTLMQARLESARFVLVSIAVFLCRVTLTIVAVVVLQWGIWGILVATAVTSAVFGLFLTLRELAIGSFRPQLGKLWGIARFALPFVPVGVFGFVLASGDRFFLIRYAGAEELGCYALGCKLAAVVSSLGMVPLLRVWNVQLYDVFEKPHGSIAVGRMFSKLLAVYVFMGVGLCLFHREAIAVLSPPEYARAALVVCPIVLASYFMTAANLADAAFYVRRRTGLKPYISAVSASTALGLYAWLIPTHGAMGAAYATLVGMLVRFVCTVLVSQRVFHVQYETVRVIGMLLLGTAIVLASQAFGTDPSAILAKSVLWVAWPALVWTTGMIAPDEKKQIQSLVHWALNQLHPRTILARMKV
ncbi:MAG: lipopolysaccharide biosynthesis protein [Planctomycetia bacterium]|nr:lipopolysaccharide biosynthesis protein [Planctomycetia bacterium]